LEHTSGKLAAFTAPGHNPNMLEGREEMLPRATGKALELLSQNENGFFIMIEGSQIDWGGHANDQDYVVTETLDFYAAVKVALDFAEQNGETLVVVTADHETGGMVVLNGDYEKRTVQTEFTTGGHTGIMIPVYAYGPGAEMFTGIYDNTDFKSKFMSALGMEESE
jgi:alkaline phosphatase